MPHQRPNSSSEELNRLSYPIICFCSGVGLAFLVYAALHPFEWLGWVGIIGCLGIALNFYVIRISVDRDTILISYGIGFVAREFDRHAITGCEMVRNSTFHAVYNPSAERVPRLHVRDYGSVTIPIDDTQRLIEILRLPHVSGSRQF